MAQTFTAIIASAGGSKTLVVPMPSVASAFPGAGNTGYSGTLKTSGAITVNTAGAIVENVDVTGGIVVNAPNVTIRNFKARGTGTYVIENHSTGLVVEDGEIDGLGAAGQAIGWAGYTALRLNVHSCGDGLRANGDVSVRDSWIHGLAESSGSHNDGIQVTEGSNIQIVHNAIENPNTETSCVMVGGDQGVISNVLVQNNLFNGGGYALYAGNGQYAVSGVQLLDNKFGRLFYPKCGYYGPLDIGPGGVTLSGNVWADTGQPVS